MNKTLFIVFLILFNTQSYCQNKNNKASAIIFKDTIEGFVFDSINNRLGDRIESQNTKMIKHFKYLGKDTLFINKQSSGDPHFICEFPNGPIFPHKTYSFAICFWHQHQKGYLNKTMSLEFSNGKQVFFNFKGRYLLQD